MARADSFLFKALVFLIRGLWLGFGIERETSWEENSRGYFLEIGTILIDLKKWFEILITARRYIVT